MTVGDPSFRTAEQIKKYPSLIYTCLQTAYTRGADTTGFPTGTCAAGIMVSLRFPTCVSTILLPSRMPVIYVLECCRMQPFRLRSRWLTRISGTARISTQRTINHILHIPLITNALPHTLLPSRRFSTRPYGTRGSLTTSRCGLKMGPSRSSGHLGTRPATVAMETMSLAGRATRCKVH